MEAVRERAEGPTVTSGPKREVSTAQQLQTSNFPQFNIFAELFRVHQMKPDMQNNNSTSSFYSQGIKHEFHKCSVCPLAMAP